MKDIERSRFANLVNGWMKVNGCSRLRITSDEYSRIDGVFFSGNTDVYFEYKTRVGRFEKHKKTTILEKGKYEALKAVASIFACSCFYIVEYDNAVFIFDMTRRNGLEFSPWNLPISSSFSVGTREKEVAELEFASADFVIGKRGGWTRVGNNQLRGYLNRQF